MNLAFALCQTFYGDGSWTAVAYQAGRDGRIGWLGKTSLASLTTGSGARELADTRFGYDRIQLSHMLLCDNAPALARELGSKLFSLEDVLWAPLPRALEFGYPLIRLPRLAWRRLSAVARREPS